MEIAAAIIIGLFLILAFWVLWRRRPRTGDHYESGLGALGEPGHSNDHGHH